jgi:predicted transcriptional regulator
MRRREVKNGVPPLSKRERQIMDVVYRLGDATASDVHEELPDAPTYTTVRGLLRILEEKGHLKHVVDGQRFVYSPTAERDEAGATQIAHVVRTFFGGSASEAVAALLGNSSHVVSEQELARLQAIVAEARKAK